MSDGVRLSSVSCLHAGGGGGAGAAGGGAGPGGESPGRGD